MCLTGGGWLLAWLAARWLLERGLLLWAALELTETGASPSSAISDRYSLSIRALSCADWGSPGLGGGMEWEGG